MVTLKIQFTLMSLRGHDFLLGFSLICADVWVSQDSVVPEGDHGGHNASGEQASSSLQIACLRDVV